MDRKIQRIALVELHKTGLKMADIVEIDWLQTGKYGTLGYAIAREITRASYNVTRMMLPCLETIRRMCILESVSFD
ncbi:hypothetical protein KIN20_006292 [Parelaphostrongylus tenuis]|uniref:Uncharacterized protein n=1 Tax=Parelaphostrongylus tenuis TaxID=148309 RepID=A0AAD5MMS6_PARTN|nr:hypothetical protein KIN20_006292 [Parelaphostrongylus tenuis]